MSYFAAAFTRSGGDWWGTELDLDDAESIEAIADVASEVDSDDGNVVILVEEEDWFGVVRVEDDDDPRVFVSDGAEAMRTTVGEAMLSEVVIEYLSEEAMDNGHGSGLPSEPVGEAGLLDDLGVSGRELRRLAADADTSPADAVATLAERLGFVDQLEAVR
ncbi:MAG TPA: tRNA adenosine deaminase-associated protein [Actinopolymorphaceae bacterium]